MTEKTRAKRKGNIVRIDPLVDLPPTARTQARRGPGRWKDLHAAVDALRPSKTQGMSVTFESGAEDEIARCVAALHGHCALGTHPEWRLRTRRERIDGVGYTLYVWKQPIGP